MIDFRTIIPQLPITSRLPQFKPPPIFTNSQNPVIDTEIIPQLQSIPSIHTNFLPLPTNLQLKNKMWMLFLPKDFREVTIDSLIQTGAITTAVSEADLRKIRLLTRQTVLIEVHPWKSKCW